MQVAVIADIHGFDIALQRVLDDIRSVPDIDLIVAAGDVCEVGPNPRGVLDILRSEQIVMIRGNTDENVADPGDTSAAASFVRSEIGDEGVAFLAALPFEHRITPSGGTSPHDDLLVVHANPLDTRRHMAPEASPEELRDLLGDTQAAVIAFGHLHIAYVRDLERMTLIDVSAVGNPKDGELRSKWGLLRWEEESRSWFAELRYVDYPVAETVEQIRRSTLPDPDSTVRTLLRASYG